MKHNNCPLPALTQNRSYFYRVVQRLPQLPYSKLCFPDLLKERQKLRTCLRQLNQDLKSLLKDRAISYSINLKPQLQQSERLGVVSIDRQLLNGKTILENLGKELKRLQERQTTLRELNRSKLNSSIVNCERQIQLLKEQLKHINTVNKQDDRILSIVQDDHLKPQLQELQRLISKRQSLQAKVQQTQTTITKLPVQSHSINHSPLLDKQTDTNQLHSKSDRLRRSLKLVQSIKKSEESAKSRQERQRQSECRQMEDRLQALDKLIQECECAASKLRAEEQQLRGQI